MQTHPHVRICDPPRATYPLRNRGSMLGSLCRQVGYLVATPPGLHGPSIRCSLPTHRVLEAGVSLLDARDQLQNAGMEYPLLAKSVWADGRPGSHAMAVVHTGAPMHASPPCLTLAHDYNKNPHFYRFLYAEEGLRQLIEGPAPHDLRPPTLLEQYIDHGTCLFKIYVLGDDAVMVKRPTLHLDLPAHKARRLGAASQAAPLPSMASLEPSTVTSSGAAQEGSEGLLGSSPPVLSEEELDAYNVPPPDVEVISRVSAYPRSRSWGKDDLAPEGHGVPVPPDWLWKGLAKHLREKLGLTLFNFDLIVPLDPPQHQRGLLPGSDGCAPGGGADEGSCVEGLVHLIDINYYPGYEKLPRSEEVMVKFLESLRDEAQR